MPNKGETSRLNSKERHSEARQELEKYIAVAPEDFEARHNYLVILYTLRDCEQTQSSARAWRVE